MPSKPPGKPPFSDHFPDDYEPTGSLWGRLGRPKVREELKGAAVLFAVDKKTQAEYLVFGRATLERVIATRRGELATVVKVPINFDTDDLEVLLAFCEVVKGGHCYDTRARAEKDPRVGLN